MTQDTTQGQQFLDQIVQYYSWFRLHGTPFEPTILLQYPEWNGELFSMELILEEVGLSGEIQTLERKQELLETAFFWTRSTQAVRAALISEVRAKPEPHADLVLFDLKRAYENDVLPLAAPGDRRAVSIVTESQDGTRFGTLYDVPADPSRRGFLTCIDPNGYTQMDGQLLQTFFPGPLRQIPPMTTLDLGTPDDAMNDGTFTL